MNVLSARCLGGGFIDTAGKTSDNGITSWLVGIYGATDSKRKPIPVFAPGSRSIDARLLVCGVFFVNREVSN